MAYIKTQLDVKIGQKVKLTEEKRSIAGYFEVGTTVTITERNPARGYTFEDEFGNRVIEAGFTGFEKV